MQWIRRLSAVVVAEDETTILGALSATVLTLFLPMVIDGGARPCCCSRKEGECAGVALLYFCISQLEEDSPQIWSRWV